MPIVTLNQRFISTQLNCPVGRSKIEYCSDDKSGLLIECRATNPNQGVYWLRTRINGSNKYFKIGSTTDISLSDARKRVNELKIEIQNNGNYENKSKYKKLTYSEYFINFFMPYITPRKSTFKRDLEIFNNRLKPVFGHKTLEEITRQDISLFQSKLKASGLGPASCNHPVRTLRRSLGLAEEWEMVSKNVCRKIPMFYEPPREIYLNEDELRQLMQVIKTDENRMICMIVLFAVATGARQGEILNAKWSEVNRKKCVLFLPAERSKNGRSRHIPLSRAALAALDEVGTEGNHEYIFTKNGKPYVDIQKSWQRLRAKCGLSHVPFHSLRHTAASQMVESGFDLLSVGQVLGHRSYRSTQIYSHLSSNRLLEAANANGEKIMAAIEST